MKLCELLNVVIKLWQFPRLIKAQLLLLLLLFVGLGFSGC